MKKIKKYIFIFIFFFSISFFFFYNYNIKIRMPVLTKIIFGKYKHKYHVTDILNITYTYKKEKRKVMNRENNYGNYLVYIYNTHDTEEYYDSTYLINPEVSVNNYIIKEYLDKNKINTYVEERSIKELLNFHNYKYSDSYKCSREYMEDVKSKNPSIKYFIDIHRDSLKRDKTTVNVNGEEYASVLFLLGLENKNYNENLEFINKINDKLNEKYKGLSKGILKKSGRGVNGVYNQDFSKYTILIEIGGQENTLKEVVRTSKALSEILYEVIKDEEHN